MTSRVCRAVAAFEQLALACDEGRYSDAVELRDQLRELGFDVAFPAQPGDPGIRPLSEALPEAMDAIASRSETTPRPSNHGTQA